MKKSIVVLGLLLWVLIPLSHMPAAQADETDDFTQNATIEAYAHVDCSGNPPDDITVTYDPDLASYSQDVVSAVTCELTTNAEDSLVTAALSGDFLAASLDNITLTHTNATDTITAVITASTGYDAPPADYELANAITVVAWDTAQDITYDIEIDEASLPTKPAGDYSGTVTITIGSFL